MYMRPGFELFDATLHPWFTSGDLSHPPRCIIKSHELPDSALVDFEATFVHLVRDGRDVVVSKYFYESEFLVKNGLSAGPGKPFDRYVEETAAEWSRYVDAWRDRAGASARYEDFLADPVAALRELLLALTGEERRSEDLAPIVARYTREKFAASLGAAFQHNTFVRKGVAGDWVNHFSPADAAAFERAAGRSLVALGYERDAGWVAAAGRLQPPKNGSGSSNT
jgi:hypothetical protein